MTTDFDNHQKLKAGDRRKEYWHVGKEVPIALIMSMLIQTGTIIWWARGQVAKDDDHDRRITSLEHERDSVRSAERMAVIEAAIADIRRSNERLEILVQQALKQPSK